MEGELELLTLHLDGTSDLFPSPKSWDDQHDRSCLVLHGAGNQAQLFVNAR